MADVPGQRWALSKDMPRMAERPRRMTSDRDVGAPECVISASLQLFSELRSPAGNYAPVYEDVSLVWFEAP